MNLNTVLAIVIVLSFIIAFALWVLISGLALITSPLDSLGVIIPGGLFFAFWGLVSYRLYKCPPPVETLTQ